MKRTAFLGALFSLGVGCVVAPAQQPPVRPEIPKVPAVPTAFDQGPGWEQYWETERRHAHGMFHGNRFAHVTAYARDCADVMVFEAMGITRSDWDEPLDCLIPGIRERMFDVPALVKRAGVDLGWMLWGLLPYNPQPMGGGCSEPDCGEIWRTIWVSSGALVRTEDEAPVLVELSPNGWSSIDDYVYQSKGILLMGDLDLNGSTEIVTIYVVDATQGTYFYEGTHVFEPGQGWWTYEQKSEWTRSELRRASAELLRDPMIRGYALKRTIRNDRRLVREIVGWGDGEGVF